MLKALRASKFFIAATALTATVALVGTSFAWFTSQANPSPANYVTMGTLLVSQNMTLEDTGFYQPGTYANMSGGISTAKSNISAMIRMKPGNAEIMFPNVQPDGSPNTMYALYGGNWMVDPNHYLTGTLNTSLLGYGDLNAAGYLCKVDVDGNLLEPSVGQFMWFTDPMDPTAFYLVADPGAIKIPVPGEVAFDGRMDNNYQAANIRFNADVFATQVLEGATTDKTIWPGQTWGVTVNFGDTTGAHILQPCFDNYVNQLVAQGQITYPKAPIGSKSAAAARGAAILAHFQALAAGEK